jgi:hypothetical protein
MHFGENQLSPGSIGISPLPTGHPPVLQHWWVRASTRSYPRFTLPMGSSPGFGSYPGNAVISCARFRLAFAPAPALYRALTCFPPAHNAGRRCQHTLAGSFYKRHAVRRPHTPRGAETPPSDCLSVQGFRGSFIPLPGCFSPFPHGTGSLSVARSIRALEGGPPSFPQDFACPVVLRYIAHTPRRSCPLRDSHPLRWAFPDPSRTTNPVSVAAASRQRPRNALSTPRETSARHRRPHGLGASPVRSPLLRASPQTRSPSPGTDTVAGACS